MARLNAKWYNTWKRGQTSYHLWQDSTPSNTSASLSAGANSITISAPAVTHSATVANGAGVNTVVVTAPAVTHSATVANGAGVNTVVVTANNVRTALFIPLATNIISVSAPTATVTRSTLRIELRHASGSVLIASWTVEPSANWEQYTYTLTQPEFEAISDWADIQLWLVS